jgi:nicotinamide mononucleotide transporter
MNDLLAQLRAVSPWETLAAVLGLAYLLLAVRRSLWCWLCAFASTAIYLVIFARASLYMQSALQVFYLAMAVYGFLDWRHHRFEDGSVAIRSWTLTQHVLAGIAVLAATAVNGWLLVRHTDAALPYLDSFVTWGSVVTTWLVARRVIENWLYWVIVDGVAVWLCILSQLYPTAVLMGIYVGIVIRGYVVWRREQAVQLAAAEPHVSG